MRKTTVKTNVNDLLKQVTDLDNLIEDVKKKRYRLNEKAMRAELPNIKARFLHKVISLTDHTYLLAEHVSIKNSQIDFAGTLFCVDKYGVTSYPNDGETFISLDDLKSHRITDIDTFVKMIGKTYDSIYSKLYDVRNKEVSDK